MFCFSARTTRPTPGKTSAYLHLKYYTLRLSKFLLMKLFDGENRYHPIWSDFLRAVKRTDRTQLLFRDFSSKIFNRIASCPHTHKVSFRVISLIIAYSASFFTIKSTVLHGSSKNIWNVFFFFACKPTLTVTLIKLYMNAHWTHHNVTTM